MGPTTAAVVSELVATGYAHLTGFDQVSAAEDAPGRSSFAFFPDPVCARIAMCLLMDDKFVFGWDGGKSPTALDSKHGVREICGAPKKAVVEMFGRIFLSGHCRPAKGDFGEVAVALYLLLCGDTLQKSSNNNDLATRYHKLSYKTQFQKTKNLHTRASQKPQTVLVLRKYHVAQRSLMV